MKNIRRKSNPMMDLSKFTSNKKNIKWSCGTNLKPGLFVKLCLKYNYVGPKIIQGDHKYFLKVKKIINF